MILGVFPAGMTNEVDLAAYLTTAVYTGELGSGQKDFSLVLAAGTPAPGIVFYVW